MLLDDAAIHAMGHLLRLEYEHARSQMIDIDYNYIARESFKIALAMERAKPDYTPKELQPFIPCNVRGKRHNWENGKCKNCGLIHNRYTCKLKGIQTNEKAS